MKNFLLLLVLITIPHYLFSKKEIDFDRIDSLIQAEMNYWEVPGCALAVVQNGKPVLVKGYGTTKMNGDEMVTGSTIFSIASCTKQFTGTLCALLQCEGVLSLDSPVKEIWKDFRHTDPYLENNLTLRDLLLQRSGLPRHDIFWDNAPSSRKEAAERSRFLETAGILRDKFEYSNLNYMLAGFIAGQAAGKPWEELMKEKIFEPLGMKSSHFSVSERDNFPGYAYPHIEYDSIEIMDFKSADILGPAGCIRTNAEDISKWLLANLAGG